MVDAGGRPARASASSRSACTSARARSASAVAAASRPLRACSSFSVALHLPDRQEVAVVRRAEGSEVQRPQHLALALRLRPLADAVGQKELAQLLLDRGIQVGAAHERVLRDGGEVQITFTPRAHFGSRGRQALEVGAVVGGHVQHAIGDRQQIGLVVGRANRAEATLGLDVARREQIGGPGRQRPGGGARVAQAEVERAVAAQDVLQRERAGGVDDQDEL
jgi:hypothetical protein